ncbi:MAG: NAD-dependent epimerase/dehydratase family protein [Chloroflexota bacterium]
MKGEVFLTGGSGFIGGHVLSALLAAGYQVRVLTRPGSKFPEADGCRSVEGDLRRAGDLVDAMKGCRYLMHVAAVYTFSPGRRREIAATNVRGTKSLLEAARLAGIETAVMTSSSATVGPANGRLSNEGDWALDSPSAYHQSKLEAERVAMAARVPTTLVLPTMPIGPGDWKPTPTGRMVLELMRGHMFATLGGGVNVVAVEDVAAAHVTALERGRLRERYLIGGENLPLADLFSRLAAISGRRAPRARIPYGAAFALGWADELRCRVLSRAGQVSEPLVPLEGVHMARHNMYVSSAKAQDELGYIPGPVDPALEGSVRWYRDHGYVGC